MSEDLPPSAARVQATAEARGLAITVQVMPGTTRTAEEAAAACGCDVGQIVKSLVFLGAASGEPKLLLVSGRNRVDERKVAGLIGEGLTRPDGRTVREITGFAIGGIPPLGHARPMAVFMDEDLLAFPVVWAAAGTPFAVFASDPAALRDAVAARVITMT
jgi:prolyl-tRNA editing enzyme YbaK/EbsC (Cys-tRNA(Pro) deacylase)